MVITLPLTDRVPAGDGPQDQGWVGGSAPPECAVSVELKVRELAAASLT
jgi:hypothetical protein